MTSGGRTLFVQLLGLGLDAFQHVLRLLAHAHQDDAFHRLVVLLKAELAEARRVADGTSPMSLTRTGMPFFLPTTMLPMSAVSRTSPRPRM